MSSEVFSSTFLLHFVFVLMRSYKRKRSKSMKIVLCQKPRNTNTVAVGSEHRLGAVIHNTNCGVPLFSLSRNSCARAALLRPLATCYVPYVALHKKV